MQQYKDLEELARQIKNQKAKEWWDKNKDKVKEINKRYWLKKAKQKIMEESEGNKYENIESIK